MTAGEILLIWVAALSVMGLVMMGVDKALSKTAARRIPERTLMLTALFGGSPGVLIGMYLFRHKTKHRKFTVGVPLIIILQLLIYAAWRWFISK